MVHRYDLIAVAMVMAMPIAAVGIVVGLVSWARDALARNPVVAVVGLVVTAAATIHLFLPRQLSGEVNRPIVALFLSEGHAQRAGLAGVQVVLLCVLATSIAVRRDQALAARAR